MTSNMFDLSGKIALITGSARGIGKELAKGLASAGAGIVINGTRYETVMPAYDELQKLGYDVYPSIFDVTDNKAVETKIDEIESEFGKIDILVNNAGIQKRNELSGFSKEDWDAVLNVNLTGVFNVSQYTARKMIERKAGKIINICSLQSELARPTIAPYAAAKGGVKMLTKSMAAEWAKYNIQTNGIGPGYFITDMTKKLSEDPEFDSWIRKRTPAGRWGDVSELIGAVIFFASEASSFINGQILYIDGGLSSVI